MRIIKIVKTLRTAFYILSISVTSSASLFAQQPASNTPPEDSVFARINDRTILYREFMEIFRGAVKSKYYHGEVPATELEEFKLQVAKDIVEQVLLSQQAIKMGLQPDMEKIQQGLDKFDQRYSKDRNWASIREDSIPRMRERLKQQNMFEQMRDRIKNIQQPDLKAVEAYYQQNPEKFTEPKRAWVSVILLSVPPSSMNQTWQDAELAARQFILRIREGESFEAIAREYSAHPSAVNGGDLGYLHSGMMEGDADTAVNNLKIGELSEPVRVLEGYTIFRLNGIQPAKLNPFEMVKERASGLLYRDLQEEAWNNYIANLKQTSNIEVDSNLYPSIAPK